MNTKQVTSIIVLFLTITLLTQCVFSSEAAPVSVHVYNDLYWGTLSKEGSKTVFTSLSSESSHFTITGTWKNDAFKGKCTISYSDGSTANVTYKNGTITGEVSVTQSDGAQCSYSCNAGNPYGMIEYYSPEGQLVDLDWYYLCTPLHEWERNAQPVDFDTLMSSKHDYWGIPLQIKGRVTALYETSAESMLKVQDDDGHVYLLKYPALTTTRYEQPEVTNVTVNERISATCLLFAIHYEDSAPLVMYQHASGHLLTDAKRKAYFSTLDEIVYYMSLGSVEDPDLEETYPVMTTLRLKKEDDTISPLNLNYTYSEICEYPLFYKGKKQTITGKVIRELTAEQDTTRSFIIQEQDTSNYYLTWLAPKKMPKTKYVGKVISFKGTFQGNAKIPYFDKTTDVPGYLIYPRIKTTKMTVKK